MPETAPATVDEGSHIRARMVDWVRKSGLDGTRHWFTLALGPHIVGGSHLLEPADDMATTIANTIADRLPVAELFSVPTVPTDHVRDRAASHTDTTAPNNPAAGAPAPGSAAPAPAGLMVFARPPEPTTATNDAPPISMVTWGPRRAGPRLHLWARLTDSWRENAHLLGEWISQLSLDEVYQGALRAHRRHGHAGIGPTPPDPFQADLEALLAPLLPDQRRGSVPPSNVPAHDYHSAGLALLVPNTPDEPAQDPMAQGDLVLIFPRLVVPGNQLARPHAGRHPAARWTAPTRCSPCASSW